MTMRWFDRLAARGGFLRSVLVLAGGAAGAQLVMAVAMPVLSRLYSPADFGQLAVFSGLALTISVAACLRWDIAIALPEADADALGLLVLSVASCLVISLLGLLAVTSATATLVGWLDQPEAANWLWLVPPAVLAIATGSALQNWFVRAQTFGLISKARLSQAGTSSSLQIAFGLSGVGVVGLLMGYVAAASVVVGFLGFQLFKRGDDWQFSLSMANLRRLAATYRRFPAFSTWEALANVAAIHIPVILIAGKVGNDTAGQLMLAMYVIQAPMGLIGGAISQVYLSEAPSKLRVGRLDQFTLEVLGKLCKVGVGPLVAIGVLSPSVFWIVFGSEWQKAGLLIAWMTPWFVLQFLASPVSMALHVTGNQRAAMSFQFFALGLRVSSVLWAAQVWPDLVAEVYAISGLLVYSSYLLIVAQSLRIAPGALGGVLAKNLLWSLPWVICGAILAWIIRNYSGLVS